MAKTEAEIYKDLEEKFNSSNQDLEIRFKDFNEYEDMYWGHLDNAKNPWKSSIYDPESFEKVERNVSHLYSSIPRGRVMPRDSINDLKSAPIHDELFRYQWTRPGQNMVSKLQRMGRSQHIFGMGWGILDWRFEQVIRTINGEQKQITVWDDAFFRDLFIYDVYPDPAATSIDDMQWVIIKEYTTLTQLKASNAGGRYKNLGLLEEKLKGKKNHNAVSESYRNRVQEIQGRDGSTVKDRILIKRLFTKDRWVTAVDEFKIIIEDRPNPHWHGDLPIHLLPNYEYPNQLYARSELDVIRKLQKGLNSVINQRLDNVRMILNPVLKVNANSRYSNTWKFKPGQKWVMDKGDEIDQFQLADVTGNTFEHTVNYFKDAMSSSLGHHDVLSSNARQNMGITATRDQLAAGEQNARLKLKESLVDTFITRLVNQWIQLNQQYTTSNKILRITGKEELAQIQNSVGDQTVSHNGKPIPKLQLSDDGTVASLIVTPEDLQGSYDFIVETGSTSIVDPIDDFQNMMTAMNVLRDSEQQLAAQGIAVNYQPMIEKILMKLGIKDIDNVFTTIQQPPQMGVDMVPLQEQGQDMALMGLDQGIPVDMGVIQPESQGMMM